VISYSYAPQLSGRAFGLNRSPASFFLSVLLVHSSPLGKKLPRPK
jgi:hypothetical protein